MEYILVIAGSDSSGGAGIQADIRTIASLGAHPLTVITAVTAQNSLGITAIHKVPATFIAKQLDTLTEDLAPHAVKIGMVYSKGAVEKVAHFIRRHKPPHVVLDPIMNASSGKALLEPDAMTPLKERLLPLAHVVTPNLHEAGALAGMPVRSVADMEAAAELIQAMGPRVIITGGHLNDRCVDVLYDGKRVYQFSGTKMAAENTHGSGCVFSSAVATVLAQEGNVVRAAGRAHEVARRAVMKGYPCGRGPGPVRPG
jgi:hydroxymethylpyrimidine/phosphomethylpyrimidine kinase